MGRPGTSLGWGTNHHHWSRCGEAHFVFGRSRHFGSFLNVLNAPPTTTRRRRPEIRKSPRARSRVPSRACVMWTKGMAGLWCSSRVASPSCCGPRRETHGQIYTTATQRCDGLCVCICDAPRGTGSILSGSMIVLSFPRRLRGRTRAASMINSNNTWVNRTSDTTGGRVPAGGVLVVDGVNRHPRPRR